jgi:GAF domain-containing protein
MIVLPVMVENQVIGAITLVFSAGARSYSSKDARLANEFARRSALALGWSRRSRPDAAPDEGEIKADRAAIPLAHGHEILP